MNKQHTLQQTAIAALCCAGIALGSYITMPLGPVPFTLQTMFVLLTGLLLRPLWAASALLAYLAMGAIGLPVFAAGSGGLGHLLGPTGGYLWGFLPAALVGSLIASHSAQLPAAHHLAMRPLRQLLAVIAATAVIYTTGVLQLSLVTGMTIPAAVSAGMLPFLLGDAIKAAAALAVSGLVQPLLSRRGL